MRHLKISRRIAGFDAELHRTGKRFRDHHRDRFLPAVADPVLRIDFLPALGIQEYSMESMRLPLS
jgi:hypothetical protein